MGMRQTTFVDILPTEDFMTILSFVRGTVPPKADLALAAINVQSYAAGKFLGSPTPVAFGSSTPPTLGEIDAIITDILPDESGTMKAGEVGNPALLALLKFVSPLVLQFLLTKQSPSPVTTGD